MNFDFIFQLAINGFLLGGFYASMTLGFSIIWGVMRLINLAHGEFLLMGAFTAWFFFNPQREQMLTISSDDATTTIVVMVFIALAFGAFLSEFLLDRKRFSSVIQRRMIGFGSSLGVALILYVLWNANQFSDVNLSIMLIVMTSLALSVGFIVSHLVLDYWQEWQNPWKRRLVGYSVGILSALGFYLLWQGSGFISIDPFIGLPIIFILFFAFGYVLQNGLFNRIVEGPYLTMLLVTFAVAIMLQSIGLQIYAADPRRINIEYSTAFYLGGNLTIAPAKFLTVIVSILMIVGLTLFLRYTRVGYAIRAAAQNKVAARLMGINIHETYAITFGIAVALTAMAGAMMGTFQPITPVTGPIWTLRAFAIVALGGLGKIQGVVVGGMVLGMAESFVGGYVGIGWATAVAFILLVVMLMVRPQGITGGLVAAEE